MLNKLLKSLTLSGTKPDFEVYYDGLLKGARAHAPTVQEALRDYRALVSARSEMPLV